MLSQSEKVEIPCLDTLGSKEDPFFFFLVTWPYILYFEPGL